MNTLYITNIEERNDLYAFKGGVHQLSSRVIDIRLDDLTVPALSIDEKRRDKVDRHLIKHNQMVPFVAPFFLI